MGLSVAKEADLYESRDNLQFAEELFDSNLKQFRNEERLNGIKLEEQRVHFQHIKMMQKLSILEAYKKDEQAEDLRRNANQLQFHYQTFKNCFHSEKRALLTARANISQGRPLGYIPDIGKIDQSLSAFYERLNFVQAGGKGKGVSRIVDELKTTLHNIESRIRRYQKNQQRVRSRMMGDGRNLDQFDISEHFELLEELIEKLDEEMSAFHVQRTTILDDVLALQAQQQANARRRINERSLHLPLREKNQKLLAITMSKDFD